MRSVLRCGTKGLAGVLVVVATFTIASTAAAYSWGGNDLFVEGPGAVTAVPCLSAPSADFWVTRMVGAMGSTVDGTGAVHASINGQVQFSINASNPVSPDRPGALLYWGTSDVHFSGKVREFPPDGFVTTPFETVTIPVKELATGVMTDLIVTFKGEITPEGLGTITFGETRCP